MSEPACSLCGGTGTLILAKSWFPLDGYRRERCGICAGSGVSAYRCDAAWAAQQKRLRDRGRPAALAEARDNG